MTAVLWTVGGFLFLAGLSMLMIRRQLLAMLLGLELMVNAAALLLVQVACGLSDSAGLAAALLVIAVAAAEAVVGLSLIIRLADCGGGLETSALRELGELSGEAS